VKLIRFFEEKNESLRIYRDFIKLGYFPIQELYKVVGTGLNGIAKCNKQ
jgi:hypothetical protein